MKRASFKCRGKMWVVRFASCTNAWGECDRKKRVITVEKDASNEMKMDAMIHEFLHAEFSYLAEDEINGAATELKDLLHGQGIRFE